MAQSVLERATELVVTHLETYRLSLNQIVWMLKRTHADLMVEKRKEAAVGRTATAASGEL